MKLNSRFNVVVALKSAQLKLPLGLFWLEVFANARNLQQLMFENAKLKVVDLDFSHSRVYIDKKDKRCALAKH